MTKTVHGIVHGRIIELADDVGLAEGQRVQVTIRPLSTPDIKGLERCAGILSGEDEDEDILQQLDEERRRARWRDVTE